MQPLDTKHSVAGSLTQPALMTCRDLWTVVVLCHFSTVCVVLQGVETNLVHLPAAAGSGVTSGGQASLTVVTFSATATSMFFQPIVD